MRAVKVFAAAQRQHQRARATASRANGTISVRALRCMRKLGCCQTTRPAAWDQREPSCSDRSRCCRVSEPPVAIDEQRDHALTAVRRHKSDWWSGKAVRVFAAAQRQASAGARDGVKGKRSDLAARAPLHAQVRRLPDHPTARLGPTRAFLLGPISMLPGVRTLRCSR